MSNTFQIGQRVFAKVRGHPPWPGRIANIVEQSTKYGKYLVHFFGTDEEAFCTGDKVYQYEEYKTIYGKPRKRKAFNLALIEIENAVDHTTPISSSCVLKDHSYVISQQTDIINKLPNHESVLLQQGSKGANDASPGSSNSTTLCCTGNDTPQPLMDMDNTRLEKNMSKAQSARQNLRRKNKIIPELEIFDYKMMSVQNESEKTNFPKETKLNVKNKKSLTRTTVKKGRNNKSAKTSVQNSFTKEDVFKINETCCRYKETSMLTDELESYKTQTIMLEIEYQLRSNLFKSEPNITTGLNALYELTNLEIKPLMLKKHPQIVWTIHNLMKFNESYYLSNLTNSQMSEFNFKAFEIRKLSEMVYEKFKSLFVVPDECTFWNFFSSEISKFRNLTENLTVHEVCTLQTDPSCNDKGAEVDTKGNDYYGEPITHYKECVPEPTFNPIKEEIVNHGYLSLFAIGSQVVKCEHSMQNAAGNHNIKEEIFATVKTEQNVDEFESEEDWLKYV
ncbi:hypothetical protein R5R35_005661 [Gryllus longicercus]|uniref:PWWP domain-containing protein n=1 Tax=Gryllus longicercus TaxID=2509291 RepID=A0AAN9VEV5_9ORTH